VIPSTLLGLLLFAGAIGPGYVYLRVSERRRPHVGRSGAAEIAELIVTGAFASVVVAAISICGLVATERLDTKQLATAPQAYIVTHIAAASLLLAAGLVAAHLLAWGAARFVHRNESAAIYLGFSSWYAMITRSRPAGARPYVTIDLADGTSVCGWPLVFTVGEAPIGEREIAIAEPRLRRPNEVAFRRTADHCIAVHGTEIRTVGVRYQATDAPLIIRS
jgi:hypothetical protein